MKKSFDAIQRATAGSIPVWCAFDDIVPLDQIQPHPQNNNTHPERQIALLAKIITTTGWRAPITLSTRSNAITKGHGRRQAAVFAGLTCAPVEYQHYADEAAELADLLADNKIAELSFLDEEKTRQLLSALQEFNADFELAGFELEDVDKLIALGTQGQTDPDDLPEVDPAAPPMTRSGDVWILGEHRLICGDACSPQAAEPLMQGRLAAMVFTDPPYNVDYAGKSDKKRKIKNDKLKTQAFRHLIRDALANMRRHVVAGGGIYVCHSEKEWQAFRSGLESAGWLLKQCLIWEKNQFVIGRQDYHWRHEPILYGWNEGASHKWYGGRKQNTVINLADGVLLEPADDGSAVVTIDIGLQRVVLRGQDIEVLFSGDDTLQSIWKVAKPVKNETHPTIKPVALVERAIHNSSRPGEIVADWFAGSGTTLIASQITGRQSRLMELDPFYCDVIVQRWEAFTGEKAVKSSNG